MKHGVYQIRNIVNNKLYIGSAAGKGFDNRYNLHNNVHQSTISNIKRGTYRV